MLNLGYDNRGGKFKEVIAPCNCPADLKTNVGNIVIEPSVRLAPFGSAFYIFAGPTLGINITKSFTYTQDKQAEVRGEWSNMRKVVFSAQAGAGIDIPMSARNNPTQITISPFASFQTNLGQSPRSVESWSLYTFRTGIALKLGTSRKAADLKPLPDTNGVAKAGTSAPAGNIQFSVRAPKVVPLKRTVKETFALRNSVFFDMGSSAIPARYTILNKAEATSFKEEQLQQDQPQNLNNGRSFRQLAVYHNILNIMGDRLRSHPGSKISLSGASDNNPQEGKIMAENVKSYLVNMFGIDGSRITTEGRDKPVIASEQPGAVKDLALLREGDRRVDIVSNSPELLMQVGGSTSPFLKPVVISAVQQDPLDSHVIFTAEGADSLLKSWSIEVTDEQGNLQKYGPYTTSQASVPGKTILGNSSQGNYKIVMKGETIGGESITKESIVSLTKTETTKQEGLRYSILFDFDKSKTVSGYENFLTEVVTPLIPENGTVIIHGHTDIIGDEIYNTNLSKERAISAQHIIERELAKTKKKGVKFQTYSFGEDETFAPFENNLPEKRFYNRTVIIDIIPDK